MMDTPPQATQDNRDYFKRCFEEAWADRAHSRRSGKTAATERIIAEAEAAGMKIYRATIPPRYDAEDQSCNTALPRNYKQEVKWLEDDLADMQRRLDDANLNAAIGWTLFVAALVVALVTLLQGGG